tara:strand:+ start:133 stop:381 length:249 start_codon:yes stop_codon:yes gene_type:complete
MTSTAAAVLTLTTQFVLAQPPSFSDADTDSDGELSPEEIAALPFVQDGRADVATVLTRWDTDTSGTVSEEEYNMGISRGMGG